MRKITFLFLVLIAFTCNVFAQDNALKNDIAPISKTKFGEVISQTDLPPGVLLRNYNVDSLTPPNVGGYGVVWTGSNYIVSEFNANLFYRFNADWSLRDQFAVTGGTGLGRDMVFAKGLLWYANVTGQIFGVDTGSKAVVKTITTSLVQIRGLGWDPVRQAFWCGTNSFSGPIVAVDTNGVTVPGATIATGTVYSIGYDANPAGPYLVIGKDVVPASLTNTMVVRYNATTFAKVDSFSVNVPLQTAAATGLASGGGEVVTNLIPGKRTWVGMVQSTPDRVIVVDLGDLPAPPAADSTLVMFHDTTVATGLVKRLADRDTVMKYIPGLIGKYKTFYFTAASTLPSLSNYGSVILVETSFDNSGALALGGSARTDLKAWLNSGTPGNKKVLISIGGDQAYNYDRTGSANIDTNFARSYCGFIYRLDNGTPTSTGGDITGLVGPDNTVNRIMLAPTGTGNTGYWPDGVGLAPGGVAVYKYNTHTNLDTLGGTSLNTPGFFTVTSTQDPRYFTGGNKGWLAALIGYAKANGSTITYVTSQISTVANNFSLSQNYPNPFNPTTKISFAIPTNGFVSLKVYDISGKEVMTLVNKNMTVGSYSVDFNGALLSSGVYFYRLESNNFVETKKMMLVK